MRWSEDGRSPPSRRTVGSVFERFTERARQVVVLAQDEARRLRHNYIGTEHILLGLLREEEGIAARVLESLDMTVEEVRAQVAGIVGQGDEPTTGQIPFTPRAKKVLELSLSEALNLGHNYIGTEHILLGLVRENQGVGARVLLDFNADAAKVRDEIVRMLHGSRGAHSIDRPRLESFMWPTVEGAGEHRVGGFMAIPTPSHSEPETFVDSTSRVRMLVTGWLLFGSAAGIGLFVGWLIWG
jgi:ATP-dependent Clp protease ATP-binding subunit ClpA